MIVMKYGEFGPRVVLLQILLNRKGARLVVDGYWGKNTQAALGVFRSANGQSAEGGVDITTWKSLSAGTGLAIIDSVDMTAGSGNDGDLQELKDSGGAPIAGGYGVDPTSVPAGEYHGIAEAVTAIKTRASGNGSIALLRFHGHGHQGQWWTVAIGDPLDVKDVDPKKYQQLRLRTEGYISLGNVDALKSTLEQLNPYFAKFASVEHHGCKIGANTRLLHKLAGIWGVPVSGGLQDQYGGGGGSTFVYEGRVYTAFPGYVGLKTWAKRVAEPLPPEKGSSASPTAKKPGLVPTGVK